MRSVFESLKGLCVRRQTEVKSNIMDSPLSHIQSTISEIIVRIKFHLYHTHYKGLHVCTKHGNRLITTTALTSLASSPVEISLNWGFPWFPLIPVGGITPQNRR